MSLAAMLYAIHGSKARGMAKLVLILIADYVDPDTGRAGPPGPSLDTLARDGGLGKATVWRALDRLGDLGEVDIERGRSGQGNTNSYVFPRFRDQQAQRSGADRSRKRRAAKPAAPAGGPRGGAPAAVRAELERQGFLRPPPKPGA